MRDENKTKDRLISELQDLRKRTQELESQVKSQYSQKKELNNNERNLQEYLDTILLNLPVGLAILEGDDFRYFRINKYLADLNGLSVEDHLGKPLADVIPHIADEVIPNLRNVLATGEGIPQREFQIDLPNGEILQLIDYHFPLGKNAVVAVVLDITTLKRTEKELIKAKQLAETSTQTKSQFLSNMSHEIRTPMAGIIGIADLVLNSDLSPQQLDCVTTIKSSAIQLLDILNEILDQSKLTAGKIDIDPVDFHLASFIYDTIQIYRSIFEEKGLFLQLEMDKTLPEGANADRMRIGQIFTNLLSNALKFTAIGGITVHVNHEQKENDDFILRISVVDSGIGLNQEEQDKIFLPFTQADSSTSRTYGGTGLGLSISKQLIDLMGGEIGIESVKGKGSKFWFAVPCHPSKGKVEATDRRQSLDRWVSSRSLKVLVVEDSVAIQQLIIAILDGLNHKNSIANNGKEATEYIEAEDFDIILMDIRMPVMDGLEATRIIRSMDGKKSNIPILALTADIAAGNIKEYINIGVNAVCAKPFEPPTLLKMINTLLDEEVHTSFSRSQEATQAGRTTDSEDNTGPTVSNTSFAQLLERVSSIIDQFTEREKSDIAEPLVIPGVATNRLSEMQADYENGLAEHCDELSTNFEALVESPTDNELRKKVSMQIHSLKGGGSIYGYHLITTIAAAADNIFKTNDTLETKDIRFLSNHINALSLVAKKRLSGYGGKAGRILQQGLSKPISDSP